MPNGELNFTEEELQEAVERYNKAMNFVNVKIDYIALDDAEKASYSPIKTYTDKSDPDVAKPKENIDANLRLI